MATPKETKLLSQCPDCKVVKALYNDGRERYKPSVVVFGSLPKEQCYECKTKKPNE